MSNILPTYLKKRTHIDQPVSLQPEVSGEGLSALFKTILQEIDLRFNSPAQLSVAEEGYYQKLTFINGQPITRVKVNFLHTISGHRLEFQTVPKQIQRAS